jgi:4-aminobutyrate aminotransferase-like enzyme
MFSHKRIVVLLIFCFVKFFHACCRPELYAVEDGTAAGQMINRLHAHGMLAVGAGTHTIRLLPPFNITMEEAEEACGIFESCLKEVQEK